MTTKNTLPAKKTAWGGRRRELQATNCSSSSKNMKNAPQSLFFNMLDFSLLRRLSVVFARALCTELELSPVKGKPNLNPISVICMAAAPFSSAVWQDVDTSPWQVQGPESQHVHRAGDLLVQLGHWSGRRGCGSQWFSGSPCCCSGWYKYLVCPLRWFLNKLMDGRCIQISRKLWSCEYTERIEKIFGQ